MLERGDDLCVEAIDDKLQQMRVGGENVREVWSPLVNGW